MDFDSILLARKLEGGGGGSSVDVEELNVTANGTYTAETGKAYSPVTVNVQPPVEPALKDINFFDYDGTLLYSYTKQEWANVTELPPNPSHSGLVAQGWNYTKADIDDVANVYKEPINIGQLYTTQSGATEIDIELWDSSFLSPTINICPNGTLTIDWGDGTTPTSVTGTSLTTNKPQSHTYASVGKYTIKIKETSGSYGLGGSANSCPTIIRDSKSATTDNSSKLYSSSVKEIRIGAGLGGTGNCSFANLSNMESISIPDSFAYSGGTDLFNSCTSLKCFVVKKSKRGSVWENSFYNCPSLRVVCCALYPFNQMFRLCRSLQYANLGIPNNGIINTSAFQDASSLVSITISSGVTTIKGSAFYNCRSLSAIHILSESVPTLENTNAFQYNASGRKIYVPRSENQTVLNAYKTASNWSTYASVIEEEPQ